jgi:hypothetical protein
MISKKLRKSSAVNVVDGRKHLTYERFLPKLLKSMLGVISLGKTKLVMERR